HNVCAVPASKATADLATRMEIPLASLKEHPNLDLVVDGADEIDPSMNLVKGLGNALLREKIVMSYARWAVIIADESKCVRRLGRGPLPVEILPFEAEAQIRWLASLCARAEMRTDADGQPLVTDNGNFIALCWFEQSISHPVNLAARLNARPGIIEHGLFLGMVDECIIAGSEGVRVLRKGA
ncbi:MAG: ribose 5-phosphate isomerase A, partial [Anaerolineaceae bacterium]